MLPFELSLASVVDYLAARGIYATSVHELGGGISNAVILAKTSTQGIVIKQSLGKLRVEQDWFSDRERIHRECDAIRMLSSLPVPAIIFEDRENCIFGMTAAPPPARPWKSILLEDGIADLQTVAQTAALLGSIVEVSRGQASFEQRFGDTTVFDQLRLDPYYRATSTRHPDLASFFADLITETLGRRYALVHGDWSPKNLLVSPDAVTAIDFEVVHYGDPAFDIAFLINHLLLKSLYLKRRDFVDAALAFLAALQRTIDETWLEPAVLRHLGALMLARVDGKSPAEYIHGTALEPQVRTLAREIIRRPVIATIKRLR